MKHFGGMQSELRAQERSEARKNIRLVCRVFFLVLLQVTVIARLQPFSTVPDLPLCYLLVCSVVGENARRWRHISISGMAMGFLSDILGGIGLGLLGLYYFLVGAFCPNLIRRTGGGFFEELLRVYTWFIPFGLLRGLITLIYSAAAGFSSFSVWLCLYRVVLPELLSTAVLLLPVFCIYRSRRMRID